MSAPTTTRTRPRTRAPVATAAADDATTDTSGPPAAGDQPTTEVDLAAILPDPQKLTVAGIPAEVRRIKMRELMLAVKAITSGVGAGIVNFNLNPKAPDFDANLAGLLMVALPDAVDEFMDLFAALVVARDPKQADALRAELDNPDPDTALDVALIVIRQEKDDLARLLGKLQLLIGAAAALYRTGKKGS